MAEAPKFVRKQYLVDRPYQYRFVVKQLLILVVVGLLSSYLSIALLLHSLYRPDLEHQSYIVAGCVGVGITLAFEIILAIPLIYHLGIRQSHRVVGPIARLNRTLEAIGAGDFSQRIRLRDGDVLQPVAEAISRMADNLQKRSATPSS